VRAALGGNGPQPLVPERTAGEAGHAIDYI
jgi:hypothetical protein